MQKNVIDIRIFFWEGIFFVPAFFSLLFKMNELNSSYILMVDGISQISNRIATCCKDLWTFAATLPAPFPPVGGGEGFGGRTPSSDTEEGVSRLPGPCEVVVVVVVFFVVVVGLGGTTPSDFTTRVAMTASWSEKLFFVPPLSHLMSGEEYSVTDTSTPFRLLLKKM